MPDRVTLEWNDAAFRERLARYVGTFPGQAEQAVFKVAARVLSDIKTGWPVQTGLSRAAWLGPRKIAPLTYQLSNPFPYARVIEYGGYKLPGPKTHIAGGEVLPGNIHVNRGVYPRQRPAGALRRALSKNYGKMSTELGKNL